VKEFPVAYRKGGQTATVEFGPTTFGDKTTPLPQRIAVRSTNQLLRSCYITNFQRVNLDSLQAARAASKFSEGGTHYTRFRELMKRCDKPISGPLSSEDAKEIQELLIYFAKAPGDEATIGETLRRLNSLVQLSQLRNDQQQLRNNFRSYLTSLRTNGYLPSAFTSGLKLIERDILRGRHQQAKFLSEVWIESVSDGADFELILSLALYELNKDNSVIVSQLLETLLKRTGVPIDLRFQAAAMRSISLDKIDSLLKKQSELSGHAKAQSEFATHLITTNNLNQQLVESLDHAQRLLKETKTLSSAQKTIKTQLQSIISKQLPNSN
jgi:hypothetical protein